MLNYAYILVLTTGVEPAHPNGHYPLKVACLPIPPRELNLECKDIIISFNYLSLIIFLMEQLLSHLNPLFNKVKVIHRWL